MIAHSFGEVRHLLHVGRVQYGAPGLPGFALPLDDLFAVLDR